MHSFKLGVLVSAVALVAAGCASMKSPSDAGFFVTSTASPKGADYGGLAGADKHCQTLAAAAGLGDRTWHAYLSASATGSSPAVNARDRIGSGPWKNVKGVVVATNVNELHADNNLTKQTSLTEKGGVVNGRGDTPNQHDVLTGSQRDGTAFPGTNDTTCGNWTKSGTEGAAMLGHIDRNGIPTDPVDVRTSWNSSHLSRGGCSNEALKSTGGAGYLYCFAAK
ncbi:MAG: hypothetical protein ABI777_03810 [Betaproteobacteria bacterium]